MNLIFWLSSLHIFYSDKNYVTGFLHSSIWGLLVDFAHEDPGLHIARGKKK